MTAGITYWAAPTVLTSAQEQREPWEQQRSVSQGLYFRRRRTEETLKNKLQRDRKSIPSTKKAFSRVWQILNLGVTVTCPARESQRSHAKAYETGRELQFRIPERISERITVPTVITAFEGEYTSDILLSTLNFFFCFTCSFPPPLYYHASTHTHTHTHTPTQTHTHTTPL